MTVRCKFECQGVEKIKLGMKLKSGVKDESASWQNKDNQEVHWAYNVRLSAVYSSNENSENRKFWNATPQGTFNFQCLNGPAAAFFEPGKTYYLDISEAPAE